MVFGTNTDFSNTFAVGSQLEINGETKTVAVVTNATSLNVNSTFASSANGKVAAILNFTPRGGLSYLQNSLPTLTISTSGGANANLTVVGIIGDGEILNLSANSAGSILGIIS